METNANDILRELVRLFVLITSDRQYCRVLDAMREQGHDESAVIEVIIDVNGQRLEEPLPNPFERRRRRDDANVIPLDRQRL